MGSASYFQKTISDKCLIIDPQTALWIPIDITQIPGNPSFTDGIRISMWISATTDGSDDAVPVEEIITVASAATITEPRKILFFGFGEGSNGDWPGEAGTKFYGIVTTDQSGSANPNRRSWYRIISSSRHTIDMQRYVSLNGSIILDTVATPSGFRLSADAMATNTNYAAWHFIGFSVNGFNLLMEAPGNHNFAATVEKTSTPTISSLLAFDGMDMSNYITSTSVLSTSNLPSGWPLNKIVITNPFTTVRLRIHAIAYDQFTFV